MNKAINDLPTLIRSLNPQLRLGVFAFVSVQNGRQLDSVEVLASIKEAEGFSAVIAEEDAISLGLPILFRARWITLTVNSDLQAVGLTAAFSGALARAGISCNVVAGAYHDHLFVTVEQAADALDALITLQKSA